MKQNIMRCRGESREGERKNHETKRIPDNEVWAKETLRGRIIEEKE